MREIAHAEFAAHACIALAIWMLFKAFVSLLASGPLRALLPLRLLGPFSKHYVSHESNFLVLEPFRFVVEEYVELRVRGVHIFKLLPVLGLVIQLVD